MRKGSKEAALQAIKYAEAVAEYVQPVVTQPTIAELVQAVQALAVSQRRVFEYAEACALET